MTDYRIDNHGSLYLVTPQNDSAEQHLRDHVDEEAQWFGRGLAVEPRYVEGLVARLEDEGWEVR